MRVVGSSRRRQRVSVQSLLVASAIFTGVSLLILTIRSIEPSDSGLDIPIISQQIEETDYSGANNFSSNTTRNKECATVEEMGEDFRGGFWEQSIRVRNIIQRHFALNGASRVRDLPPEQFCRHGFVLGKASEAGFGNEMYKILTAAALSIMLDRSLIIGQTRHIGSLSSLSISF